MSTVLISQIQVRRGLKSDLPENLEEGELGFCLDTREVFIGNGPGFGGNTQLATNLTIQESNVAVSYNGVTQTTGTTELNFAGSGLTVTSNGNVQTITVDALSSNLAVALNGSVLTTNASELNFTGAVSVTDAAGIETIHIGSGTSLTVSLNGTPLTSSAVELNFVGNVTVTDAAGHETINIIGGGGGGPTIKPISFFFTTTPSSLEPLLFYTPCETINLSSNFAGSVASTAIPPTATYILNVRKNGVSVGNITIATSGSATFTSTGPVTLTTSDQLSVVAPVTVDATIQNVSITFKGS